MYLSITKAIGLKMADFEGPVLTSKSESLWIFLTGISSNSELGMHGPHFEKSDQIIVLLRCLRGSVG